MSPVLVEYAALLDLEEQMQPQSVASFGSFAVDYSDDKGRRRTSSQVMHQRPNYDLSAWGRVLSYRSLHAHASKEAWKLSSLGIGD